VRWAARARAPTSLTVLLSGASSRSPAGPRETHGSRSDRSARDARARWKDDALPEAIPHGARGVTRSGRARVGGREREAVAEVAHARVLAVGAGACGGAERDRARVGPAVVRVGPAGRTDRGLGRTRRGGVARVGSPCVEEAGVTR
jgi:hypothetical protein